MGYTTDFEGQFTLDKPLTILQKQYLEKFSRTRRMKRNPALLLDNGTHSKVGLGVGVDGGYFVDGGGFAGQEHDDSVVEYNGPPKGQAGLWCHWVPTEDGEAIVWDGGEKFYDYVEWLKYIIEHFLKPWGYTLNGRVEWFGEDRSDQGIIIVENNNVTTKVAKLVWD